MSQRFSRSVAETAEFLVALKRLEKFFELDEKKTDVHDHDVKGHVNGNFSMQEKEPGKLKKF